MPVIGLSERKAINNKLIKEILQKYELAGTLASRFEKCEIDLLTGNNYYVEIVSVKRITLKDGLYLLSSSFLDFTEIEDNNSKEPNLKDFWKFETIEKE